MAGHPLSLLAALAVVSVVLLAGLLPLLLVAGGAGLFWLERKERQHQQQLPALILEAESAGDWERMDELADELLELRPDLGWPHWKKGLAERNLGTDDRGAADFRRAVKLEPALEECVPPGS